MVTTFVKRQSTNQISSEPELWSNIRCSEGKNRFKKQLPYTDISMRKFEGFEEIWIDGIEHLPHQLIDNDDEKNGSARNNGLIIKNVNDKALHAQHPPKENNNSGKNPNSHNFGTKFKHQQVAGTFWQFIIYKKIT